MTEHVRTRVPSTEDASFSIGLLEATRPEQSEPAWQRQSIIARPSSPNSDMTLLLWGDLSEASVHPVGTLTTSVVFDVLVLHDATLEQPHRYAYVRFSFCFLQLGQVVIYLIYLQQ